ncbi:MAG: hypothetical protein KF812_01680 [Fimbriimonadaceae bacterium]|nr:hypothetical protein [Fimbriimonadaceae bacterium]
MADQSLWPCVSLTYDGALLGHLETVVPDLDSRGLRGTFFGTPTNLLDRIHAWRDARTNGHEIGYGTLLDAGPLDQWDGDMIREQVDDGQHLLVDVLSLKYQPSVALPWDAGMVRDLAGEGVAVRAGATGLNREGHTRLDAVRIIPATNASGLELVDYLASAKNENAWIVFAFKGIGEGEDAIDLASHRRLLDELARLSDQVPVRTFGEQSSRLQLVSNTRNPRLV